MPIEFVNMPEPVKPVVRTPEQVSADRKWWRFYREWKFNFMCEYRYPLAAMMRRQSWVREFVN